MRGSKRSEFWYRVAQSVTIFKLEANIQEGMHIHTREEDAGKCVQ